MRVPVRLANQRTFMTPLRSLIATALAAGLASAAAAQDAGDNIAVAYEEDGRYFTADDIPTYNVAEDGTVDWLTFSGFRRNNSKCDVCNGPDGEESTNGPEM